MSAIDKAIKSCGGLGKLASGLGVSVQRISNWRVRGVPVEFAPAIERLTKGAVRCEEFHPDVDWAAIRGTSTVNPENTPNIERAA